MFPKAGRTAVACAIAVILVGGFRMATPPSAHAGILSKVCGVIGKIGEGWWGNACNAVSHPKQVLGAGKALLTGKPGQALKVLLNGARSNVLSRSGAVGIAAIVAWAVGGAHFVLGETAKLVGASTSPELMASWFSSVYWRVAGVAALLTLPFLFAAGIQAVVRSDAGLLARAVFAYLPLSFVAIGIAAPLTMLLLRTSDWMGTTVASAAGDQGSHFLVKAGVAIGALGVAVGSPFVTFLIALLTAAGGLILWLELLIRAAAVYVVVLMLPLVFAAMVWPARRVWAIRSVEVLVALILAKFAIVAVLALAAAALGHGGGSLIVRSLAGLVLIVLGAFAPWALLRLLPLAEIASAAAGHMRDHAQGRVARDALMGRRGLASMGDGVAGVIARMQGFQPDPPGDPRLMNQAPAASAATIAQLDAHREQREAAGSTSASSGGIATAAPGAPSGPRRAPSSTPPPSPPLGPMSPPTTPEGVTDASSGSIEPVGDLTARDDENEPKLPPPDPEATP